MFLDYMVFLLAVEKLNFKISRWIQIRNHTHRDVCYTKVYIYYLKELKLWENIFLEQIYKACSS